MGFFLGEYECKLDNKGRLVLPSRIKSSLPEPQENTLVLEAGFEDCLVLYPMVEFKKIYSRIMSLNEFDPNSRVIQRNFFSRISEVELDNMGRFLIPKNMLKHAKLEKDVVIVGMGNRVELWNDEAYENHILKDNKEFSDLAQKYLTE